MWTTFVEGGKGSPGAPSIHACAGRAGAVRSRHHSSGTRSTGPRSRGRTCTRTSRSSRRSRWARAGGRSSRTWVGARACSHGPLASRKLTGRKRHTGSAPSVAALLPPPSAGVPRHPQKCPVRDSLVGKRSDDSRGPLSGRVIEHDGVPAATAREWSLSVRRGSAWRTRLLLPARERKAGQPRLARSLVV